MARNADLTQLIQDSDNITAFLKERFEDWEKQINRFLQDYDEYANAYRLITKARETKSTQYTRTRVGETIRSTEALATSIYRMCTSNDPSYEMVSTNISQSNENLLASQTLMMWQDQHKYSRYKRNLLRALRGGTLFGTTVVEHPYIIRRWDNQILFEGLGFRPRSLLQTAFEPRVLSIDDSPWFGFLDYFTEDQLWERVETDPDNWDAEQVQLAIDNLKDKTTNFDFIKKRRLAAGYNDTAPFEVVTYYGRLKGKDGYIKRADNRLWFIRVINMSRIIFANGNPEPLNEMPVSVGSFLEFENEPFGHGTGRLGSKTQSGMDSNRERYMDIVTMALFNMWIKSRGSGVLNSQLRIRPNGVVETEEIDGIKPHSPNLNAVNFGIKLEEILKSEHQGVTGATPNLQALITDASATEASIAQNEGIRRVSVVAEGFAEPFIRDYQMMKHRYNSNYMELDLWLAITGEERPPMRVNRVTYARDAHIIARIVTDKDFRPKRLEALEKVFTVLTSIRQQVPEDIDVIPVLKEWLMAIAVNPRTVFSRMTNLPALTAQEIISRNLKKSRALAESFGDLPIEGGEGGAQEIIATPAGNVSGTP